MKYKLIATFIVYLIQYTSAFDIRPSFQPSRKQLLSNNIPNEKIFNGFTPGRFDNPHVVLLVISNNVGGQSCTGSLIHPNWVVTAGHCAAGATSIKVHLGLFSRNEGAAQVVTVPSTSIFVHPNFVNNKTAIANDIALLKLNPGANTAFRQIRPIPYACASAGTFAGRNGRVCGWGITRDNNPDITLVIQCIDMPIITNPECQQIWQGFVRPTNICTRVVNGRTVCHGDSGGPLTAIDGASQRQKLLGALSFNSVPCATFFPVAFARVALYESWIRNVSGVGCDPL